MHQSQITAGPPRLTSLGLYRTAREEPSPHKDAHVWLSCRSSRSPRLVDRQRRWQARTLLQLARSEDGRLRIFRERTDGPFPDQDPAVAVPKSDQLEGEDPSDYR